MVDYQVMAKSYPQIEQLLKEYATKYPLQTTAAVRFSSFLLALPIKLTSFLKVTPLPSLLLPPKKSVRISLTMR